MGCLKNLISSISRVYCVIVTISPGFLLEGEVENISLLTPTLLSVSCYLESKSYTIFKYPSHQWTLDITQHGNSFSYKYIIEDRKLEYSHIMDLTFYNILEFELGDDKFKMPGVINPPNGDSATTQLLKELYELALSQLSLVFLKLLKLYVYHRCDIFPQKVRSYLSKGNLMVSLESGKFLEEESEELFNARKEFINQYDELKRSDFMFLTFNNEDMIKELSRRYGTRQMKDFIGDSAQSYSDDTLKLYIQRCYEVMNEATLFFEHEKYRGYRLINEDHTFTMRKSKVLIFDINTEEDAIQWYDLVFKDANENIITLDEDDVMVYNHSIPDHSFVVIHSNILDSLDVHKVTIERFSIFNIYIREILL